VAVLDAFSVRAAATAYDVRVRYGWAVVLVAALLPIAPTPVLAGHAAPVPGFFTSGQSAQYVHDGPSVLSGNPRGGSASFTAMGWDNATGQGDSSRQILTRCYRRKRARAVVSTLLHQVGKMNRFV
jgi:hypothetical protein